MGPRSRASVASTSALPASMTGLNSAQVKAIKQNVLTEHFEDAPENFAKQGMDVANVAMYAATEIVEESLMNKFTAEANGKEMEEDDNIQDGIYKLETLLEAAIDKHFDLFEIYILRNTFALKTDIIPYIILPHQEGVEEESRDQDEEALQAYQEEIRLYEEELTKERELLCVKEYMNRRLEGLRMKAEQVGFLNHGPVSLLDRVTGVVAQIPLLSSQLDALLAAPVAPLKRPTNLASSTGAPAAGSNPWGNSRAGYINWSAAKKLESLPAPKGGASQTVLQSDEFGETGRTQDAIELVKRLQA